MANNVEVMDQAADLEQGASSQPVGGDPSSALDVASLQAFVDKIFTEVSLKCLDEIGESAEFTKKVVVAVRGKEATGNEFATVKDLAKATRLTNAMVPHMTKIVYKKENAANVQSLDSLKTSKADAEDVEDLKEYAENLERRIKTLEDLAKDSKEQLEKHRRSINENRAEINTNEARLKIVENKMKDLENALLKEGTTLHDLKKKMDLLDKAVDEGTLAGVTPEAWKKLSSDMYEATTREMGRLKIERHQRSVVIFGVEATGYTAGDTNDRILRTILQKAGMDERVPLLAIRSIEFRGRKTASKPTLDSSKPKPTMFVAV